MATVDAGPGELNILGKAGDDLTVTLEFIDDDTEAAENMSGGTWSAKVRAKATDVTAAATMTVDVTNAATGVLVVTLDDADTTALCTGMVWRGVWDLFWSTDSRTYVGGTLEIRKDVTR